MLHTMFQFFSFHCILQSRFVSFQFPLYSSVASVGLSFSIASSVVFSFQFAVVPATLCGSRSIWILFCGCRFQSKCDVTVCCKSDQFHAQKIQKISCPIYTSLLMLPLHPLSCLQKQENGTHLNTSCTSMGRGSWPVELSTDHLGLLERTSSDHQAKLDHTQRLLG